jgi:phosphohistidine phosphatase
VPPRTGIIDPAQCLTIPFSGASDAAPRRYCVAPDRGKVGKIGLDFQRCRTCSRLTPYESESALMIRLLLLRHAKSDWSTSGMPDRARPLNPRGAVAARLMGGYMARHALIPQRVLCSPAQRTRETWDAVSAQWPSEVGVAWAEGLYAATPQAILSVIQSEGDAARALLVVGHNPGLQEAAELLIAAGDVALRERLREKFPTGALVVIDFAADKWSRIHERSGRLDRYVTPRSIAAETS